MPSTFIYLHIEFEPTNLLEMTKDELAENDTFDVKLWTIQVFNQNALCVLVFTGKREKTDIGIHFDKIILL